MGRKPGHYSQLGINMQEIEDISDTVLRWIKLRHTNYMYSSGLSAGDGIRLVKVVP